MTGARMITQERDRHRDVEGFTDERDDKYVGDELAWAAVAYAAPAPVTCDGPGVSHDPWPWSENWDKRPPQGCPIEDRIRALVKAGALCAAEIDRLIRKRRADGLDVTAAE